MTVQRRVPAPVASIGFGQLTDLPETRAGHGIKDAAPMLHGHAVATGLAAGFMSTVDKTKLDGIAAGAGTGAAFTTIAVLGQGDVVADAPADTLTLVAGANVTITTDATTDAVTIAAAGGGGVADGDKGDITVSIGGLCWFVDAKAIGYAKIQDVTASDKLLGRAAAGAGTIEEIDCTAFARTILDDVDASAVRTTIGAQATGSYQPLDGDLTGLAALNALLGDAGSFVQVTGAGTFAKRTAAQVLSDIGAQAAGSYQPLDADLTGLAALNALLGDAGSFVQISGAGAFAKRTAAQVLSDIGAQAAGSYQPLDGDLTGLAALNAVLGDAGSFVQISGAGTFAKRTAAQVLGDIGAQAAGSYQPLDADLTGLAALNALLGDAGSFVQISGAGAFAKRTAAQVLSDIGAQAAGSYQPLDGDLTGLAALNALAGDAGSFVQISGAGAFAKRTAAQVLGDIGAQPVDADLTALAGIAGVDGDVIVRSAGAWTRLAKGTGSQQLRMNAGATLPEWFTPGAGSTDIRQAEIDLGSVPRYSGRVTLTDAAIAAGQQISVELAPGPYTGKGSRADEAQMYAGLLFQADPGAGSAALYWSAPKGGIARGNVKINYLIG